MIGAVVAEGVEKSYGDIDALQGVSLAVDPGEVYALVGPNGSGKTTLVRCLTGTTAPESGDVSLFGTPPGDTAKDRLGLLPQDYAPPDRLTPRELVEYYAGLYDAARDPDEVLAEVGIDAERDTFYGTLSGGEKRRTCVAAALVNDPDVLFLDEPTTAVDPAGRRALWQVFEDLADAGTTVFLTTHDMAEAERLADRVGLLANGTLIAEGTPDALVAEYGGPTRLIVETAATAEDATPETATDVDDVIGDAIFDASPGEAGGWTVTETDDGLVFEDVAPQDVGAIVDALEAGGIRFDRLTWREPDLEDAYLALADGEAAPVESEVVAE